MNNAAENIHKFLCGRMFLFFIHLEQKELYLGEGGWGSCVDKPLANTSFQTKDKGGRASAAFRRTCIVRMNTGKVKEEHAGDICVLKNCRVKDTKVVVFLFQNSTIMVWTERGPACVTI